MTKEDLISKIEEQCAKETIGWWIFKWKSSYWLTKIEPYFKVQIIEQLPAEFTSYQLTTPIIVLSEIGVSIHGKHYLWSEILVTALLNDRARGYHLIIGLSNGQLVQGFIGARQNEETKEFGHMVEIYKLKAKQFN